MRIDLDKKFSIKQLLDLFLLVALPIICVCGASPIPYMLKGPLSIMIGVLCGIYIIVSDIKLKINEVGFFYFLFLVYVAVSLAYTIDFDTTLSLLLIYACAFPMLFMDFSESWSERLMNIFLVISLVIAFSIIISLPIENCMEKYFSFIVNPKNSPTISAALRVELASGLYSGFAREKGEAAYIMNVGIAVIFGRFFTKGSLKKLEIFYVIVMMAALLLTGKRMMFMIVIILFVVLMCIVKMDGKAGKVAMIVTVSIVSLAVALIFIPALANTFMRFGDAENMATAGNREILWEHSFKMIGENWLFGAGFGGYNQYAFENGFRYYGERWNYHGHNIYYQSLGELGIIGFVLLFGFVIFGFVRTIRLLPNKTLNEKQKKVVYFSFYIQLMTLIYGVTGNALYARQIMFLLVLSIAMILPISEKYITSRFNFARS